MSVPPPDEAATQWRDERRQAADAKADALRRAQQAESDQARALLERFVAQASAAQLPICRLYAQAYSGNARYRTDAWGWYLKRDGSVGVGTQGQYYVLKVAKSLAARLHGVHIEPVDPPLIVGKGARDGESIDLKDLLALRLAGGAGWALGS